MISYHSIEDIVNLCNENNMSFWQVILRADASERMAAEDASFAAMRDMYRAMKRADAEYDKTLKSPSGLSGGDGEKMRKYNKDGKNLCGPFMGLAMEKAIKMGESNACMKRIVAAPTAGSCGVVPAVLINYENFYEKTDDSDNGGKRTEKRMTEALLVAAGIGNVIAQRASLSGAAGGCQAEIGTSSAMAAGALAYLRGGDEYISDAAALALKNMLGLACDPVAGLVEVPCVKRNASGAMNALCAADMALAGIKSFISADEVFDAMREIGELMSRELKETGKGGLAVTPTACRLKL